jgi:hypothetical protein
MRVCPKCGYIDLEWRTNGHRPQVEYRWSSEVPISDNLKNRGFEQDEFFAYRLAGRNHCILERVPLILFKAYGKTAFYLNYEHAEHWKDPSQTTLFDVQQKEKPHSR